MKKNIIKYFAILALGMIACEKEFKKPITDADVYSSGEADFSKYVAVGDSFSTGHIDGAIFLSGQESSFPNLMANMFAFAGGGKFTQPLFSDNIGGMLYGDKVIKGPRLVLSFKDKNNPTPVPYTKVKTRTTLDSILKGPFNNMGVSGAKSYDLISNDYGNITKLGTSASAYYIRFASSPNATIIGDAVAQKPTFFTLCIGNNDVLWYADAGGSLGEDHNVTGNMDPSTYGFYDITNNEAFALIYRRLVDDLTANNAKGVLISLPGLTTMPFFTAVPYNPLNPSKPEFRQQIPTLNNEFSKINAAFAYLGVSERSIKFSENTANAAIIKDKTLVDISKQLTKVLTPRIGAAKATIIGEQFGQVRQANANDLLLLPCFKVIGKINKTRLKKLMTLGLPEKEAAQLSINGVSFPLGDEYVIIPSEKAAVDYALASYNATIKKIALEKGLAFFDAESLFDQITNGGVSYDGGTITAEFINGGGFSLDGYYPTARGYAVIANKVIEAIEAKYKSKLPSLNPGDYDTITLNDNL